MIGMFLRKHRRTKDGKTHTYWSLVETIRTPQGPRQRVVGYLGELHSQEEEESYRGLVRQLHGENGRQRDLFRPFGKPISVYPDQITVERVRDFGDAWVGVGMWKLLQLDRFFSQEIFVGKEEIPWESVIQFLVVSRFLKSMSKLRIAEQYVDQSALGDILGVDSMKINKNRLYRAMDEMLDHKEALGEHLKKRYGELFHLDYDLLLYDITSTYFEGQCLKNKKAKRGYSRDKRPDCKQVTLALVVTREGFPLYFEVFDGNRRDVTTVEDIVERIEEMYGKADRVWAMDRGMVSEENLEWLRERGTLYIVGTPKSMLKQFERHLVESNWEEVYPDVEVKKVTSPEYQDETFVVCRSGLRREKEKAMIKLFFDRIEGGLRKLSDAAGRCKRPLHDRDVAQRKIGALLQKNSRAARLFDIHVNTYVDGKETRLKINWKKREENNNWVDLISGCYLLRTNVKSQLTGTELWKAYIQLTQVEEAFRLTKQDLGIRPVWHHNEERVEAHIFICFLALALHKTLEQGLVAKGLGRSTRKILEEFRGLKSMDVVLPTENGDRLRLRIVSNPDPALKILLDHLNLRSPKRLSSPKNVVEKTGTLPYNNQPLSQLLTP